MRVVINGEFIDRPLTGSGTYLRRLLLEFDRAGRVDASVLCPVMDGLPARSQSLRTPFDGSSRQLAKVWREQVSLPRAAGSAELIHYPFFAAPLTARQPVVVTVHDLIPMLLPAYRGSAFVRLYTSLVAATTRRARLIVTDSAASRDDVVRLLRVPAERVRVVLLAADERFRPSASVQELVELRARLRLPDRFVLYLGGLDQRKNVNRLIEAYSIARKRGLRLPLVIAGKLREPNPLFPDPREPVERLGLEDSVLFCGPGLDSDTPLLYQAATVFVYPSLYEGFGLPPLEAMASGTPVVCSNTSSLPEVVADAALTVDPLNLDAIADAILAAATDQSVRESLRARGLARAATFSWERTALETEAAYAVALVAG